VHVHTYMLMTKTLYQILLWGFVGVFFSFSKLKYPGLIVSVLLQLTLAWKIAMCKNSLSQKWDK